MRFGYLLPGTFASGPQAMAVCPDGSIAGFGQDFTAGSSTYTISFYVGAAAFRYEQEEGGKYAGEIGGRPAVLLAQNEQGYERSRIGLAPDNGVIVLDLRMVPLEEAVKIANGIECGVC